MKDRNLKLFDAASNGIVTLERKQFRKDSGLSWAADFLTIDGMTFRRPLTLPEIRRFVDTETNFAVGVQDVQSGRLRGFCLARWFGVSCHVRDVISIGRIAVLPDDRGLGVGRILIAGLRLQAGHHAGGLQAYVRTEDLGAHCFFKAVGFRCVGQEVAYYDEVPGGLDVYRFVLLDDEGE